MPKQGSSFPAQTVADLRVEAPGYRGASRQLKFHHERNATFDVEIKLERVRREHRPGTGEQAVTEPDDDPPSMEWTLALDTEEIPNEQARGFHDQGSSRVSSSE